MGEIYCLYSTEDGKPRYIGQTEYLADKRYKKHLASAIEMNEGILYDWVREVWRKNFEVEYHTLQTNINPSDLDFYEIYWISQFPDLLNIKNRVDVTELTTVGNEVIIAIQSILKNRENNNPS